jgi:serine/threonine-protein kinase RsbW
VHDAEPHEGGAPGPGPAAEARLALPRAGLGDLAAIRAFVGAACAAHGAPDEVGDALTLAADEVCTNIVRHGYAAHAPGPITLAVEAAGGALRLTIADTAPAFDPAAAAEPDVAAPCDEREEGGLGWFLVRRVVDELRYERRGAANVVTLVKHAG